MSVQIGQITITHTLNDDGETITGLTVDGDMPLATSLGLLELAKDTLLRGAPNDEA